MKENCPSTETELPPPSYDANDNNGNAENVQTDHREFVQISMTADHIEIVELEQSGRQSEHSNSRVPDDSVSTPSGLRDTNSENDDQEAPSEGADNLGYISDSTESVPENNVVDAHTKVD